MSETPDHGGTPPQSDPPMPESLAASLALWREDPAAWWAEWQRVHDFKVTLLEANAELAGQILALHSELETARSVLNQDLKIASNRVFELEIENQHLQGQILTLHQQLKEPTREQFSGHDIMDGILGDQKHVSCADANQQYVKVSR